MLNKKWAIPAAAVLVVVGIYVVLVFISNQRAKSYSVVYLSSQTIYIGHLHTFPKLAMTDGYILQNVTSTSADKTEKPADLQLVPLSSKPWAPAKIYFNPNQILFQGPLDENSDAAKAIKAKSQ